MTRGKSKSKDFEPRFQTISTDFFCTTGCCYKIQTTVYQFSINHLWNVKWNITKSLFKILQQNSINFQHTIAPFLSQI